MEVDSAFCSAVMIASPGSGQGKTLITAALARHFHNQGKRVQVFKIGPDYLDPTILECASGQAVYNLDLWMMGELHCRKLLFRAAKENQVIILESLMGLHDNQPSNAELARMFDIPVVLVLNVAKFAQTASAIVEGMEKYGTCPVISAVIGNRVGSDNHHRMMCDSLGDRYVGSMRRDDRLILPERHLGLVQAAEVSGLDNRLTTAADALDQFDIRIPLENVNFVQPQTESSSQAIVPDGSNQLQGKVIAIARDAAFSFLYPANILLLKQMGAKLVYFSPLENQAVPECDAIWLPGGYPELFLEEIDQANRTIQGLIQHHQSNKPLLAECGGMMVMCRTITDKDGKTATGCGVFEADCNMTSRFQSVGLQSVGYENGEIRGHSFHHSIIRTYLSPDRYASRQSGDQGEPVYVSRKSVFSYMHHYFPSNPQVVSDFFSGEKRVLVGSRS